MRDGYKLIVSLVCFIVSAVVITVFLVYLPVLSVLGSQSLKTIGMVVAFFLCIFVALALLTLGCCIHIIINQYRLYRINQEDPTVRRNPFPAGIV